jgi:hypothetical protein
MYSNAQIFFNFCTTVRTLLRSPSCTNFTEEFTPLPTHILGNSSELSESSIKHLFAQHPNGLSSVIQVFHEDHITSVTKDMSLLEMEIFAGIVNPVVYSCNKEALFLVIFRPLLFSRKSALQQFQLALHNFKKLGRFYKKSITGGQKLFKPNIYPNGVTMWHGVGNVNVTLDIDRGVPSISFVDDAHLLNYKATWDWAMQVNWNQPKLGQGNMIPSHRVLFKLGKQQRFELPKLLESWEPMPNFLKSFPCGRAIA